MEVPIQEGNSGHQRTIFTLPAGEALSTIERVST
jgi:hypothetical protein